MSGAQLDEKSPYRTRDDLPVNQNHVDTPVTTRTEVPHEPDQYQHGGANEASSRQQQPDKSSVNQNTEKAPPNQKDSSASTPGQEQKKQGPPGGYDATPIPHKESGYSIRITFHRATNLPIGDLSTLASDPYLIAELTTDLPKRHKEDPILAFRTRTIFDTCNPEWSEEWLLENIPASGFDLKARIYDEDRGDADDRLGNAHIQVGRIDERWEGIKNQPYKIKKRSGSKRAYLLRAIAVCFRQTHEMSGHLYVSVEVLGKTKDNEGGRAYTAGLQYWCKHYAPMLGRLTGQRTTDNSEDDPEGDNEGPSEKSPPRADPTPGPDHIPGAKVVPGTQKRNSKSKVSKYNFQANQMQLRGPVPPELYHRYVEFKPWIKSLFTGSGIRGIILKKALQHQHAQVYNFDRETVYGVFKQGPCEAMTQRFLDLCHHDEGGRMFTYVLTLDALLRFTETGKEFGIDMLSKHTMHSDASIYIAFSGEFFIRRRQDGHRHKKNSSSQNAQQAGGTSTANNAISPNEASHDNIAKSSSKQTSSPAKHSAANDSANNTSAPVRPIQSSDSGDKGRPIAPHRITSLGFTRSPSNYELVIDNDSGTYRPNAALLPLLHSFLSENFPGLEIMTLDCQSDAELMNRLKTEQREKKKKAQQAAGGRIVYTQASASSSESSIESSDVDRLDDRAEQDERAEQNMVDDTYRREEFAGTGQGRSDDAPPQRGQMHSENVNLPQPKHRLGDAMLPYVHNQNVRNYLTTRPGHDGADDYEAVAGAKEGQRGADPYEAFPGAKEGQWDGKAAPS